MQAGRLRVQPRDVLSSRLDLLRLLVDVLLAEGDLLRARREVGAHTLERRFDLLDAAVPKRELGPDRNRVVSPQRRLVAKKRRFVRDRVVLDVPAARAFFFAEAPAPLLK